LFQRLYVLESETSTIVKQVKQNTQLDINALCGHFFIKTDDKRKLKGGEDVAYLSFCTASEGKGPQSRRDNSKLEKKRHKAVHNA
jgi:hypothetical protein